jgi:phospholipid/cholesterol/gamma-HCH transport system substrate-binding protein
MDKKRLEWRVGFFVFIGLLVLAMLLLQFSKGTSLFKPTYSLFLKTGNVGGLKKHASVLMAGVPIGTVSDIEINPQGTNVVITLKIYTKYVIHKDAIVRIEQSGFLGDQYVAIVPTLNQGEQYQPNDHLEAQPPFNLQEVARSAAGFLKSVDQTTKRLDDAIADVRRLLLNEETLTNLAVTVGNARVATEHAVSTVDNINNLVTTNSQAIALAVSNVVFFSQQINEVAGGLKDVVSTNGSELNVSMKNLTTSTESLKSLLADVQSGKGLAGNLLKNEQLATNVNNIAVNFSVMSSNINRLGLWHFLWHKEIPPSEKSSKTQPNKYEPLGH